MKYIKGFDSLRAISILLVILSHLGLYSYLPEIYFIQKHVWLVISGTTGVQIFFTLSGFLITRILLIELNRFGSIHFKNFFIKRFLRLLPPLIVFYTALLILTQLGYIETPLMSFLFSIFYIYNFIPSNIYTPELGQTWSLALEEQYYLIWPFIIYFLKRKVIFIFILLILIASIISIYQYPNLSFTEEYNSVRWFIPAVTPIIIGSFFSLLINQEEQQYEKHFKQKNLYLILSIVLFLFPLYSPFLKLTFIFQSIGISLFLLWLFFNQESKMTAILNNKQLAYIGQISYGLYVYQGLFLRTGPYGAKLWIQQFPNNLVLTIITAVISYHLLEKPVLSLKRKYSRKV